MCCICLYYMFAHALYLPVLYIISHTVFISYMLYLSVLYIITKPVLNCLEYYVMKSAMFCSVLFLQYCILYSGQYSLVLYSIYITDTVFTCIVLPLAIAMQSITLARQATLASLSYNIHNYCTILLCSLSPWPPCPIIFIITILLCSLSPWPLCPIIFIITILLGSLSPWPLCPIIFIITVQYCQAVYHLGQVQATLASLSCNIHNYYSVLQSITLSKEANMSLLSQNIYNFNFLQDLQ